VRKISTPTGIRSSDRQASSESLYRLSYPGPKVLLRFQKGLCSMQFVFLFVTVFVLPECGASTLGGCAETSDTNHPVTWYHVPKQRTPQLHHCVSLKTRKVVSQSISLSKKTEGKQDFCRVCLTIVTAVSGLLAQDDV
jgi:hypothetical protein